MPFDPGTGGDLFPQTTAETPTRLPTPEETLRAAPGPASAKRTVSGQQRQDRRPRYGAPDRRPNLLRRYRWRTVVLRSGRAPQVLTGVENVGWEDNDAILTGTLTVRDSSFGIGSEVHVREGDRIRLYVDRGGGFRELWTMRVYAPALAVKQGQRTYRMANDLDLLRRSTDDLKFVKDRAHPKGWAGHEMIREICRVFGVRVAALPKMKFRRVNATYPSVKQGKRGVLGVIEEIVNVERMHTGRRFVIRWEAGALWVFPYRRSPHLLALGPTLIEAAFSSAIPSEDPLSINSFASAISIRSIRSLSAGADKKGVQKKKPTKVWLELESPASRRRFGYVHRVVFSADAGTFAQLRSVGLQYLALIGKPVRKLTLTHAGMPELRRGDAIRLGLGDEALRRQLVWVTGASFALSPSDFTMSLTVVFDDPYVDKKTERILDRLGATAAEATARRKQQRPPLDQRSDLPAKGQTLLDDVEAEHAKQLDTAQGGAGGR